MDTFLRLDLKCSIYDWSEMCFWLENRLTAIYSFLKFLIIIQKIIFKWNCISTKDSSVTRLQMKFLTELIKSSDRMGFWFWKLKFFHLNERELLFLKSETFHSINFTYETPKATNFISKIEKIRSTEVAHSLFNEQKKMILITWNNFPWDNEIW